MGAKVDENLANGRDGIFTFRINGVIHHRIGSVLPAEHEQPVFSQIYILDGEEQVLIYLNRLHEGYKFFPT